MSDYFDDADIWSAVQVKYPTALPKLRGGSWLTREHADEMTFLSDVSLNQQEHEYEWSVLVLYNFGQWSTRANFIHTENQVELVNLILFDEFASSFEDFRNSIIQIRRICLNDMQSRFPEIFYDSQSLKSQKE